MSVRRFRPTVVALATVAVALGATGSASAQPNQTPPPKKGCTIELKGPGAGQSIVYDHGYSFSIYGTNDRKTHTYTCNDGKWEETVSLTAPPLRFGGVAAPAGTFQVLDSGAGQLVSSPTVTTVSLAVAVR